MEYQLFQADAEADMLERARDWLQHRLGARGPEYVFISYPKSGRTWVRLMLGKALADHLDLELPKQGDVLAAESYSKLDGRVPSLEISHDGSPFLQSEEELSRDKSGYSDQRVILLVRDPRDVVISSWYRREKAIAKYDLTFEGSISDYVRDPLHGVAKVAAFMNIWAAQRGLPKSLLLLRYEDFITEPHKELRRLLEFLGFNDVSNEVVRGAVEYGRFDNMQTMEREDTLDSNRLRPLKSDDPSTLKVRKGQPGGYRDDLGAEDIAFVDGIVADKLDAWFAY